MIVRFLTLAQQEVDEAFRWFEEQSEGTGLEFLDELDRGVRLIRSFPFAALEIRFMEKTKDDPRSHTNEHEPKYFRPGDARLFSVQPR